MRNLLSLGPIPYRRQVNSFARESRLARSGISLYHACVRIRVYVCVCVCIGRGQSTRLPRSTWREIGLASETIDRDRSSRLSAFSFVFEPAHFRCRN